MTSAPDNPVLIVAPMGQDAPVMAAMLRARGIPTHICEGLGDCAGLISPDTAALLLTEEALEFPQLTGLMDLLRAQEPWSELPVIVLTTGGENRLATLLDLTASVSGTVTMLERPMQAATLLSAVQVALRSRRRQYQVRELLEEQQRSVRERAERAQQLERVLAERTLELMESHETLRRTEAMAVLGALASGISHDLGNLLMPLRTRLDVLQDMQLPTEVGEHVRAFGKNVEYLTALAKRLRLYLADAGRDPKKYEALDVARWYRDTEQFFRGILSGQLKLASDVPRDLPTIAVNKAGLTQAVYNLVQNAGKAINRSGLGGTITLRASIDHDAWLLISVEDDGPGMTPDVLSRCMERSFTTDAISSLGLGLALVKAFVESSGASIEAQSPPNGKTRGTSFIMRFPIARSQSPQQHVEPSKSYV